MKNSRHLLAWAIPATLLLLIGLGWTLLNVTHYAQWVSRHEAREATLDRLRALEQAAQKDKAALHAFEALTQTQPPALQPYIQSLLPSVRVEVRRRDTVPATGDWRAQRMEAQLDGVLGDDLGRLLVRLEKARPPWRLVECTLQASDQTADAINATLILEGLERK